MTARFRAPLISLLALALVAVFAMQLGGGTRLEATHMMPCPDVDGDTTVSQVDVDIESGYFFQTVPPAPAAADMVPDGTILAGDIAFVAGAFGSYTTCQDTPFTWKGGIPAKGGGLVDPVDLDGDGCDDTDENGADETMGGDRDYLNPWDFFNPSGDGFNDIGEVVTVVGQYFIDYPGAGYTTATDRTPPMPGADLWDAGPPNGMQRVDDIINIINQYFHAC